MIPDTSLVLVDTLALAEPTEIGDAATLAARKAYWATMRVLRPSSDVDADEEGSLWPTDDDEGKDGREGQDEEVW